MLPELEATWFTNACTWYECLNNQPLMHVCPWVSSLGVRPAQVADVHWTNWHTAQKVWLLPHTHTHTNFVKNPLGCTYNYVEYCCLHEDATVTCSHTHTHVLSTLLFSQVYFTTVINVCLCNWVLFS
jgi:hypothetical protein